MGIKGRRKKLREREARERDEGPMERDAGVVVMGDGPFQNPLNSLGELRIKKSELYKLQDQDYLDRVKEEHQQRRQSHLNAGRKRQRTEEEQMRELEEVDEALLGHHYDTDVALEAILNEGKASNSSSAAIVPAGPHFGHPLIGLDSSLATALQTAGWSRMTRIQERTIPYALQGYDILGQARTGSGKTLAFCVPILQAAIPLVQRQPRHTTIALILAPTKELCVQTEGVLRRVTEHLSQPISVRLITGGTKAAEERRWLSAGVSVVVGTPGRIHDHSRHCKGWELSALRFFVLDEADRMLADGFQRDLDDIISTLPRGSRQTFLFSATNSKSVQELARLSLHRTPIFISTSGDAPQPVEMNNSNTDGETVVPAFAAALPPYSNFVEGGDADDDDDVADQQTTAEDDDQIPSTLRQFCHIVPSEDRLLSLYVFVKRIARKSKGMVFCSTVASTTFHYQMMGSVGFHNEVMMLHGHMKHRQRVQAFQVFNEWETGVLFCTDVAARGLDIPKVEWILQYDPPLDPTEYIHRIGRTARAGRVGQSLLFLTPEEVHFVRYLKKFGIHLEKYPMPAELPRIQEKLEHVLQLDPVVAKSAVAAYRAHVGAYQSHILKETFDVHRLDLDNLATAFALTAPPKVTLPKCTVESKQQEYVKGKLKSLNRRRKEALRLYEEMKTKPQWDGDMFVGVARPK